MNGLTRFLSGMLTLLFVVMLIGTMGVVLGGVLAYALGQTLSTPEGFPLNFPKSPDKGNPVPVAPDGQVYAVYPCIIISLAKALSRLKP